MRGGGVVDGIAKVGVVGKVSMNFEFIEGGEARYKVVKFEWVRIVDEEIVHDEGESGGDGGRAWG